MKKAVSPVIATLLLILIAVAAAVLVYVWVTGYATSITTAGTPELRERIKVEAVSYNDTSNTLTIYVRNVGDVSVTIDSIYVMYAENSTIVTMTTTSVPIDVNDVESMDVSVSLATDTTYVVKVVTTNGVEAASTFTV
ncbi:MAG: flagellar biosynthesis protein FlaG [Thermoprotei archaeon]|nr:MAG: flagellar biosynthesis protein FlaG [Thermoprotei archaeon]